MTEQIEWSRKSQCFLIKGVGEKSGLPCFSNEQQNKQSALFQRVDAAKEKVHFFPIDDIV